MGIISVSIGPKYQLYSIGWFLEVYTVINQLIKIYGKSITTQCYTYDTFAQTWTQHDDKYTHYDTYITLCYKYNEVEAIQYHGNWHMHCSAYAPLIDKFKL